VLHAAQYYFNLLFFHFGKKCLEQFTACRENAFPDGKLIMIDGGENTILLFLKTVK